MRKAVAKMISTQSGVNTEFQTTIEGVPGMPRQVSRKTNGYGDRHSSVSSETSSGKISDAIRSLFERSGTGDFVVERNEELDSLRTAFTDCVAGKGRVALISGGLASGKT